MDPAGNLSRSRTSVMQSKDVYFSPRDYDDAVVKPECQCIP